MPAELTTGQLYTIRSVIRDGAASVNGLIPLPTQIVRLGLNDAIWEIDRKGEDTYQFSVKDRYRYSGEEDGKVIATVDGGKNMLWHVTHRPDSDAWTIESTNAKDKVWTVANESDPESEIVLRNIEYLPIPIIPPKVIPTQLFKFDLVPR